MRHINIPVFIPHLGCPNTCVFCNQRLISGTENFDPDSVVGIIEEALSTVSPTDDCEIAFFGGSFTGIDRELMIYLLDIAEKYVKDGRVSRLRCSTRPDYISEEITDILSGYSMKTVELGIQSMEPCVLAASRRGHSAEASKKACELLISKGFTVGGQMMVGLPGASAESEVECAYAIAEMGCTEARVYPTIVFSGTELEFMMKRGEYSPLSVEEAVLRTAKVLRIFDEKNVRVLRVGLCDSENLHSSHYSAGPNHASIGEMCESRIFFENITEKLDAMESVPETVYVNVPIGAVSKAVGHKRSNAELIKKKYGIKTLKFRENGELSGFFTELTFN